MTRSRSMLWLSLALLLLGSRFLIPDLFVDPLAAPRLHEQSETGPPGSSSSASLIDPIPFAEDDPDAVDSAPPQRLDVRGNEIARPVARYRVDERGSLYEVHSPQTEVPRLKPPLM